jgi:hypothetical protein
LAAGIAEHHDSLRERIARLEQKLLHLDSI